MPKRKRDDEWVPIEVTPYTDETFKPIEVSPLPRTTPVVEHTTKPATGKKEG